MTSLDSLSKAMNQLYDVGGLNTQIFYAVNHIQGGAWYEQFMLLGSMLGDHHLFPLYFILLVAYAVLWVKLRPKEQREAALWTWGGTLAVLAVSYGADGVMVKLLKTVCAFPRPFKALPEGSVHLMGPMMEASKHYESFPSGHASFAMLLVAGLWPLLPQAGRVVAVVFLLWVGVSRLALGVHFPTDVIMGYISCFIVVYSVRYGYNHIVMPQLQERIQNG